MVPDCNSIFQSDQQTDQIIADICKKYEKVLLVVEDKNEEYQTNLDDFRSLNIHENTVSHRMITLRSMFFYLVRKGFLKAKDFDVCILRFKHLTKMEISTFQVFYRLNSDDSVNLRVYTFLDEIKDQDDIYLESKLYKKLDDLSDINKEKNVQMLYFTPEITSKQRDYLQLKKILNFEDPQNLEEISYKLVFKKIVQKIKIDKFSAKRSENYKTVHVDEEKLRKISLNYLRLRMLKTILEQNANKKIYVVCKRAILLNTINFFNKYTENIDLIIYFDIMDVDISASKAIFFIDFRTNIEDLAKITLKYDQTKNSSQFLTNVLDNKPEDAIRTEEGAYVEKSHSHVILNRILTNIKHVFEQHLFFLSNLSYSDAYIMKGQNFKCFMKLPEISDHSLFTRQFVSENMPSKKEALHDVTFSILNQMLKEGCVSGNFVPNPEFFILCDFYKTRLQKTYDFNIELLQEFDREYLANYKRVERAPFDYYIELLQDIELKCRPKYFTKVYNWIFLLLRKFAKRYPNLNLRNKFKQKYMVTFKRENTIIVKSRAIPRCFTSTESLHLFSIKSETFELGILCGESFKGAFEFDGIKYRYIGKKRINVDEFNKIAMFNVVFFGINYKKRGMSSNYNYFVVPLQNDEIFVQKFVGDFYTNQNCTENLLFNPFNRNFYIFDSWVDKNAYKSITYDHVNFTKKESVNFEDSGKIPSQKIDETLVDSSEVDENVAVYDENNSRTINQSDSQSSCPKDNLKIETCQTYNIFEYFEQRYAIKLQYTDQNAKNLMYLAKSYSRKMKDTQKFYFLTELTRVSPFKSNIAFQFDFFKNAFAYFEVLSLAAQAQQDMNLPISVNLLSQCFMSKNDKYPNYERYEFFGDCVLKYLVTKFFLICYDKPIGTLVDTKCRIIRNSNLTRIGRKISLESYFSNLLFQPPSLADATSKNLQDFFKFNHMGYNPSVAINQELCTEKTYADIIEAILGACYLENGMEKTEKLIFDLEIIQTNNYKLVDFKDENSEINTTEAVDSSLLDSKMSMSFGTNINFVMSSSEEDVDQILKNLDHDSMDVVNNSLLNSNNNEKQGKNQNGIDGNGISKKAKTQFDAPRFDIKRYLLCQNDPNYMFYNNFVRTAASFTNAMKIEDIQKVEKILKYQFKHKGFLEKAMIHPSSNTNIFGTRQYFEKLELAGDSILDVLVTDEIFSSSSCPYELHEKRKDLVCNQIFGNVLFNSKLYKYAQTCFSHSDLVESHQHNSYKKIYGDIFEAINGAILLDCQYDIHKFKEIWNKSIKKMLFDCFRIRASNQNQ
ncbi:dsRNA-specific nuclease Dicer, ribonuclease [Pseudoloma neurophilia]|uniref:DsRNA-specific nuclease Dicer, ribonuclease n=1 Tax=Pseudoloma neurophilia TaxID=146866 RepID=A0A0R0LY68_9MICR|nr:dsRNA-specific nuclease Dicer, ribonuclease [Pseudoloma neurophilia]